MKNRRNTEKISEARNAKTKNILVLQGNYGYGWDDICTYDDTLEGRRERKVDYQTYIENEPNVRFRTIERRVANPNYVAPNTEVESLKLRTNEKLYVDSFDDAKCIGYGFLIRNMNTAYINLYWYRSEDLAKQNLTIAELMSDEDNYDYDSFEDDVDTIVSTADGVVEEIDWRHDIDYFNKDGREVCAYNTYTFDDDEYVELIDGEHWVDLYF